jgi:UDP-N-acetylglucosamine 2-epimerase
VCEGIRTSSQAGGVQWVLTYPNADAERDRIVDAWKVIKESCGGVVIVPSLGRTRFLSAMANFDLLLGNSSSGIVEAPTFALPVINVGNRQLGRTRGLNVLDVEADPVSIVAGIQWALSFDRSARIGNPYGDGQSSARIVRHMTQALKDRGRDALLLKHFVDIE